MEPGHAEEQPAEELTAMSGEADQVVPNSAEDAPEEPHQQQTNAGQSDDTPSSSSSGVLRLRGLPFTATVEDVHKFFEPFALQTVFLCKRHGRSTGEGYVVLKDKSEAPQAQRELDRKHLGNRFIELFSATNDDLSVAKSLSVDRLRGYVVRLRGLPYNASASDVLKFLSGIEVVRGMEGIVFTYTSTGRPTGEAFVEIQDEDGLREAMKRHKELLGTRYIELFTSTKADMIQAIQHNRLILGLASRKGVPYPLGVPAPGGQMFLDPHMPTASSNIMALAGGTAQMRGAGAMRHGGPRPPFQQARHAYVPSMVQDISGVLPVMGVQQGGPGMPRGPRPGMPRAYDPRTGAAAAAAGLQHQRMARPGEPAGARLPQAVPQSGAYFHTQGIAGQQAMAPLYSMQLAGSGSAAQTVLVQQPYVLQQGLHYDPSGMQSYGQMAAVPLQQEQFAQMYGAQAQQGQQLSGQTYTLAIQLPSGNGQELQQLGGGIDMGGGLQAFDMLGQGDGVVVKDVLLQQ